MFSIVVQIRRIHACYILHNIIITLWLKFIFRKVISTFHVIDIWTWNEFSGMNIFFLLHYDLHLLKVLNTKWCSPHYACIMWKEQLKELMDPKKKKLLFSSMFFLCFKIFGYRIIFIYVLIIWVNTSHLYYIVHVLWY